jgi:phage-related tail fiber protein
MAVKMLTGVDNSNQRLINVADPSAATDAVTKQYVDLYINGISLKAPVRVTTTSAITLSGVQTIDGVSIVAGDRVLVKDQASALTNGIYVCASGAWARALDADVSAEVISGMTVFVSEGTISADKQYSLLTNAPIVLNTTALTFGQTAVSGATLTAGNGISLPGNAITAVAKAGGSLAVDSGGIYIDPTGPLAAKRYAVNVPAGSTTATITHNLGTLDVVIGVSEITGGAVVFPDPVITSTNVVTLTFATAPTAAQYRCVIVA